jgi:hypothetical protein
MEITIKKSKIFVQYLKQIDNVGTTANQPLLSDIKDIGFDTYGSKISVIYKGEVVVVEDVADVLLNGEAVTIENFAQKLNNLVNSESGSNGGNSGGSIVETPTSQSGGTDVGKVFFTQGYAENDNTPPQNKPAQNISSPYKCTIENVYYQIAGWNFQDRGSVSTYRFPHNLPKDCIPAPNVKHFVILTLTDNNGKEFFASVSPFNRNNGFAAENHIFMVEIDSTHITIYDSGNTYNNSAFNSKDNPNTTAVRGVLRVEIVKFSDVLYK